MGIRATRPVSSLWTGKADPYCDKHNWGVMSNFVHKLLIRMGNQCRDNFNTLRPTFPNLFSSMKIIGFIEFGFWGSNRQWLKIGSGNGLAPSSDKPLPAAIMPATMMIKFTDTYNRPCASMINSLRLSDTPGDTTWRRHWFWVDGTSPELMSSYPQWNPLAPLWELQ